MSRKLFLICLLGLVGAFPTLAWHEPDGSIHPSVRADGERFVVIYTVRHWAAFGELTYNREGKLLAEKTLPATEETARIYFNLPDWVSLREGFHPLVFSVRYGKRWLLLSKLRRDAADPMIGVFEAEGMESLPAPKGLKGFSGVIGALIDDQRLYVLGEENLRLVLKVLELPSWKEVANVNVPDVRSDFPSAMASNPVWYEGVLWWVYRENRQLLGTHRIMLAGWDGVTVRSRVLTDYANEITSFSLAHLGEDALLAYHVTEEPVQARIVTVPFKLKLPPL